jgi:hypothetical protein
MAPLDFVTGLVKRQLTAQSRCRTRYNAKRGFQVAKRVASPYLNWAAAVALMAIVKDGGVYGGDNETS